MTCCPDETSNKSLGPERWAAVCIRWWSLALVATFHHASPVFPASVACREVLRYQHCREDPDGVQDLDCFWKPSHFQRYFCTWRPGREPSEKTYTLLIHQPLGLGNDKCDVYANITSTSVNINVFDTLNLSAQVFESGASHVCTKAFFQGLLFNRKRCGPPDDVSFRRLGGRISVNVYWHQNEIARIKHFAVRYRAQGSQRWMEPPQRSENATAGTMGGVNSSLAYGVQVRCVNDSDCNQCAWSRAYDVQPELRTAPDLADLEEADGVPAVGCRRLSLTWKFDSGKNDSFCVTVGKASGEAPRETFETTERKITFILSYSSYHLEISAFNNVSTSSPLRLTVPRRDERLGVGAGKPNVTVHGDRSFTISVRDDVIRNYICYSAEWMGRGQKAAYMSYYSRDNSRTLVFKNHLESLEPYRRYTLTLHVRPNKDSCSLLHVNNSESTYGTTQFYFLEGSPAVAPENISSYNVMLDSAVLQWSSITEEDARGFLLGYVIYYSKYQQETRTEKNVTVNPDVNSHTLVGLESRTPYEVQIAGFTRRGVGVRSKATAFTTDNREYSKISGIIKVTTIVTTVLIFGSPIIKRAKRTLWPSIPNPEKSKTMQKMELTNELELLQSISTLRVEDWETHSLQIVEKGQFDIACVSGETASLLEGPEDELGDAQDTHLQAAPAALAGGYTTMEVFRQVVPWSAPASREREPDVPAVRSQLDHVRQWSADSTHDNGVNH